MAVDPVRNLAAAILLRAVRDATGADRELAASARYWLAAAGPDLAEALDICPEALEGWLERLPALRSVQREPAGIDCGAGCEYETGR